MRYRPLGPSGLTVSEIGFGCAGWWAKPQFDERQAIGLVHAAIDGGVTLFDTGASYGVAEARLGRALKGRDAADLVIATKAGTFRDDAGRVGRDFSPAAVTASVERSLNRLGLEQVGLLQLHGPAALELTDELQAALAALKTRGLVRALGVNSFEPAVIDAALRLAVFDVVMVDYNVLRLEREPLIRRAATAGKGVLAGMPLAMGNLGRGRSLRGIQDLWYTARSLARHRQDMVRGRGLGFLQRLEGLSAAQAALAFVLGNPDVAAAVIGTTRLTHLQENLAASGLSLPGDVEARIRRA